MAKHQELMREKALLVTHILSKLTIDLLLSNIPRNPQPYHTSALSGEAWLIELILGHPDCIRCELGMDVHTFKAVTLELWRHNHESSKYVSLEEQLAIFLYICVTGLPIRHVGERFQRSNDTISRYVYREAMSTIWRTWTQRSGLYTNDNEVLTHLYRRFKLEVDNRRWFDSSWIEQRVNRRWKNSTVLQVA